MEKKDIKEILQKFGLPEDAADYYANLEMTDRNFAWLSAFRFVRPLNNRLQFYKNEYPDSLRSRIKEGLHISAFEAGLLEKGATPELLGEFAYDVALTAYNEVLYRLSDPAGGDYDLENEGDGLPSWVLAEIDTDGIGTERSIAETHNIIPFSNF